MFGNKVTVEVIESQRLEVQKQLDVLKTQAERNRLGQFATPPQLALEILEYAQDLLPDSLPVHFLDPAFGTGAFYAALLRLFSAKQISEAWGYEVDPHYGQEALTLWHNTSLNLKVADFTRTSQSDLGYGQVNLLICNPPYVRHHHISTADKSRLHQMVNHITGLKLSGLAGLYCYFLLIAHDWLAADGLAAWLIPSEFMDVNYGQRLKQYLLQQVTLLHIHRFNPDDAQFEDALVSSAVVWFKKSKPPLNHQVRFSYGGTLAQPAETSYISVKTLTQTTKWTGFPGAVNHFITNQTKQNRKLGELFTIKRGLVTGANKFFIVTPEDIIEHNLPAEFLRPILPSPRYLFTDEVRADEAGNPVLSKKLFLLACTLAEHRLQETYPSLWAYFQMGVQQGLHERYLCRHRSPWYTQENRPATSLLCTYMGRISAENNRPFRFILNYSAATAPNVYLMLYPKPALAQVIDHNPNLLKTMWQTLNDIPPRTLIGEGRIYGGGLHKIEPNELANAPADTIFSVLPTMVGVQAKQLSLFD